MQASHVLARFAFLCSPTVSGGSPVPAFVLAAGSAAQGHPACPGLSPTSRPLGRTVGGRAARPRRHPAGRKAGHFPMRGGSRVGPQQLLAGPQGRLLAAAGQALFEHSGVDWRAFVGSLWHNLWYDPQTRRLDAVDEAGGPARPDLAPRPRWPAAALPRPGWDPGPRRPGPRGPLDQGADPRGLFSPAPFRGDLRGPCRGAALFGKSPTELRRAGESLILAVLLQGQRPPEHVAQRACVLAERINAPTACEPASACRQPRPPAHRPALGLAPMPAACCCRRCTRASACRAPWMRISSKSLSAALKRLGWREAAGVLVDNASGEVLAYVGAPEPSQRTRCSCCAAPATCCCPLPTAWRSSGAGSPRPRRSRIPSATTSRPTPDDRLWVQRPQRAGRGAGGAGPGGDLAGRRCPEPSGCAWPTSVARSGPPTSTCCSWPGCIAPRQRRPVARAAPHAGAGQAAPARLLLGRGRVHRGRHPGPARCGRRGQPLVLRQYVPDGRRRSAGGLLRALHPGPVGGGAAARPSRWRGLGQDFLRGLQRNPAAARPSAPPGVVSALVVCSSRPSRTRGEVVHPRHRDRAGGGRRATRRASCIRSGAASSMRWGWRKTAVSGVFRGRRAPAGSWWRLDGERLAASNGNGNGNGNGKQQRAAGLASVAGRHLLELMSAEGAVLDSVSFAVRGPGEEALKASGSAAPPVATAARVLASGMWMWRPNRSEVKVAGQVPEAPAPRRQAEPARHHSPGSRCQQPREHQASPQGFEG